MTNSRLASGVYVGGIRGSAGNNGSTPAELAGWFIAVVVKVVVMTFVLRNGGGTMQKKCKHSEKQNVAKWIENVRDLFLHVFVFIGLMTAFGFAAPLSP